MNRAPNAAKASAGRLTAGVSSKGGNSVKRARSTGPALFVGGWALKQLWLFWLAPILGAALAGVMYPLMAGKADAK